MRPNLSTSEKPHILDSTSPLAINDQTFPEFCCACKDNDILLALQLAPILEPNALTVGLNHAVGCLHFELARQLLQKGVQWDSGTVAEASKSIEAIKLLFDFGFTVNSRLLGEDNLLRMVVRRNDELAIRYLLERGANPNLGPPHFSRGDPRYVRNIPNSGSVLDIAASICTPKIFALLLEHGAILSNSIALHCAAGRPPRVPAGERIPMLEYLIGLGIDIDQPDDAIKIADDGRGQHGSPLMYMVIWGRTVEARWLLEHGADPDKLINGSSAIDRAKRKYRPDSEIMILLQEYSSKV